MAMTAELQSNAGNETGAPRTSSSANIAATGGTPQSATINTVFLTTLQAKVTGYQTYDEIFGLLKSGEIDAFALSRDQLNAIAKKIPGTRVLDETFKQTITAVAVPLNHPRSLAFVTGFMTEATSKGALRKAYDNNGLKDTPIRLK